MQRDDDYFLGYRQILGYRQAEQERLRQQAQQLAHESEWLFDSNSRSAIGRLLNFL